MLTGLYGEEVAIDSLLDKGPLVINFWATWCSPCKLEMPHLEKLYREFAPKGVQFAAVSVDMKRNAGRVKTFLEKQELTVPAYIDHDTRLAKGFNVRAIPTTIIILPDRSQYHRNKGYRPGDEVLLRKHLQAILESAGDEGDDMAGEAGEDGEGGEADKAAGRGAAPGEAAVRTEPEPARETGD
ncbi:MAG: TlpA disulfide reductase family protein [bacterium]